MFHHIIYPKFQRTGLATELISRVEKVASDIKKKIITLNIFKRNYKAIFLYEKLGYKLNKKEDSYLNYHKEIN